MPLSWMPSPAKVVQSCRVFLCVFFYLREQCKRATAHHLPLGASLTPPGWRYKPQDRFLRVTGNFATASVRHHAVMIFGTRIRLGIRHGGEWVEGGGGCVASFVGYSLMFFSLQLQKGKDISCFRSGPVRGGGGGGGGGGGDKKEKHGCWRKTISQWNEKKRGKGKDQHKPNIFTVAKV